MKTSRKIIEENIELMKLLKKLDENVDLILVEGKRDREALRRLGCKSNIIVIGEIHKPIFELTREIELRNTELRIAVLMDFDEEGEKLNKKIEGIFEGCNVVIEKTLKDKLKKAMLKRNIRRIEELIGLDIEDFNFELNLK
ncbi:MAG: hypothetical protein N3E39_00705 [Candidatus Methanomethylicia archaeon]|nr:hypothetical protein [Candidatus Methanomethylicia archaeon]